MRIILFYQYFGTPKGSWSTRIYELSRRWVESGHKVTVVTAPYEKSDIKANSFISKQYIENIELIIINSGDSNRLKKLNRVFRAITFSIISVYYALFRKFDIAISSSGPITIGLPILFCKKFRNKKVIFEVRDLWPAGGIEMGLIKKRYQKNLALWFEKLIYKNSDHIITASVGQKNHIQKRFPKLPITVIPNASDNDLFGVLSKDELPYWAKNKKLFTHIGSLGYIHNIKFWLEVAQEIKTSSRGKEILLIFIGEGVERKQLENEKRNLSLFNVHFLGLKPKVELPIWVQKSVATLFATLDNPIQNTCSPNKIFDSFAAGIPIVQTSTGWIGDLVENSKCGINVPLSNPKLAADLMMDFAEDDQKIKAYGRNAKSLAVNKFNRDLLAKEYLSIVEGLTC
ncbi:glycosyltransferase family 4 protein [Lutimonas saemankumensis]|uniref:glycosyltransferase family 4 protein n=1 Tax=Lutimonas saemankumensis TaxID=483016 RepID=UPI001CD76134|nr:glycosyltransferase family 4 protein [Lutimonas saemankumensis]MCA0931600.1 glycosyltransferase family 4 protein [Lutimonas saemankumensis]